MWLYHDEMGGQKTTTLGLNKMEIRIPSDSKLLPIFFECPISDCVDQPRVTDSALAQIEQFARPKFDYFIKKQNQNMKTCHSSKIGLTYLKGTRTQI